MTYKVKLKGIEIELTKDIDGSFIIPDFIKNMTNTHTALKPSIEPICVARKPLSEKTVAENMIKWGTGGINIDGCRIGETGARNNGNTKGTIDSNSIGYYKPTEPIDYNMGRFPANIIFDEEAAQLLDKQSGISKSSKSNKQYNNEDNRIVKNSAGGQRNPESTYSDKGGASRFFYVAKVSKKERNLGLDSFEEKTDGAKGNGLDRRCSHCNTSQLKPNDCKCETPNWITPAKKNTHPTLKPIKLMSYLIKLVTPENGIVLDPFMGSGSTGIAAMLEGKRFVGIELDEEYFKIAEARINAWEEYKKIIK